MKPRINRAKIDATTEADIRRHMRADGQVGNDLADFAPVIPPQALDAPFRSGAVQFADGEVEVCLRLITIRQLTDGALAERSQFLVRNQLLVKTAQTCPT